MRFQYRQRIFKVGGEWSEWKPWIDIGPAETFILTHGVGAGQFEFRVKKFVAGFYQSRDNAMTVKYFQTADDVTLGEWMRVSLVREGDDGDFQKEE